MKSIYDHLKFRLDSESADYEFQKIPVPPYDFLEKNDDGLKIISTPVKNGKFFCQYKKEKITMRRFVNFIFHKKSESKNA